MNNYNYEYGEHVIFPHEEEKKSCYYEEIFDPFYYKKIIPELNKLDSYNFLYKSNDKNIIDIYTLGDVHNIELLYYNCRLLKKYFKAPFNHIILTSSREDWIYNKYIYLANEIGNCSIIRVPYIRYTIFNPFYLWGIYLNFIVNECIPRRNSEYFGLIDADIFLNKNFDVHDYLNNDCCGKTHSTLDYEDKTLDCWYLWYGFSFYKTEKFRSLDFTPKYKFLFDKYMKGPFYETGGRNYFKYFYNRDRSKIENTINENSFTFLIPEEFDVDITRTDLTCNDVRHFAMENFDQAYHFMNSGLWCMSQEAINNYYYKWDVAKEKVLNKLLG